MSKTCPNCGVNSPDNAKFCIECAHSLEDVPVNKEEKSVQKDTASNNGSALGGIIVIAIIAITVVGVGFFIFGSGGSDNVQPNITITFDDVYVDDYEYDGKISYTYFVNGFINNYPDNDGGYMVKTIYYDSNGSQITSTVRKLSDFKGDEKYSFASTLGSYYTDNYIDIDHISVQILKDNVVLDEFNSTMDKNRLTSVPNSNNSSK